MRAARIFYWFMAFTFVTIFSNRAFSQQILINADALLDVSSGEIIANVSVLVEGYKYLAWASKALSIRQMQR
jgi:hypothetical protein